MENIDKTESIDDAMIEDVTGPQSEIKIKQEARQGGARISKNSKKIVFVVVGGLCVAILGGVLAAGGGGKSKEAAASVSTEADSVGREQPPAPPQHFADSPLSGPGASDTSGSPADTAAAAAKNGLLSGQANKGMLAAGAAGQQRELSPAEKYKAWLIDQRYKKLEGNQLSADSAQESGFGDASMSQHSSSTVGESVAGGTNSGQQSIIDAIRALEAKGMSTAGFDPALVAAAHSRSAAGGQIGEQDKNKSFLADSKRSDDGYLHAQVESALGKHELLAGSVIPAVLLTALDSDLPGFVTAQVRQTVYDSLDHNVVLIPQGAKLVGQYSSDVSYGQSRALVAWSRVIFPNGSMIDLQGMAGTDGQGQAGFNDQVDNHYTRIFGSSILMSLLGAAAQLSQPTSGLQTMQPTPQQQAAAAMASGMSNTGNQLLSKNLSVQPTIKIRAGYLFNVMVNKSMVMPVWTGE